MSESEFLRRTAPPARTSSVQERCLWTLVKDGQVALCMTRIRQGVDGVELCYVVDGQFESRRRYLGTTALVDLRPDAEAMRATMMARGWKLMRSSAAIRS